MGSAINHAMAEFNDAIVRFILGLDLDGRHECLKQMGVDQELLELIRQMPTEACHRLRRFPSPVADVALNANRLRWALEYADKEASRDRRIDALIRMGASQPMMEEFAVTREDYRLRRKRLGLDSRQGRPPALTDAQITQITRVFRASREVEVIDDPMELYYRIGVETGIPLGPVWGYLHEQDVRTLSPATQGGKSSIPTRKRGVHNEK
jgi:hypothetical protein